MHSKTHYPHLLEMNLSDDVVDSYFTNPISRARHSAFHITDAAEGTAYDCEFWVGRSGQERVESLYHIVCLSMGCEGARGGYLAGRPDKAQPAPKY